MWLWAAWRGHLAVCVSRQLRHLLALVPLAVSRQHGHCHRRHRHGNRIPWLPGCHQGEQVPASECELNLSIPIKYDTHLLLHTTTTDPTPLLSFPTISGHLLLTFLLIVHANIGRDGLSHMYVYTPTHAVHRPTQSPISIFFQLVPQWQETSDRSSVCIVSNLRGWQRKIRAEQWDSPFLQINSTMSVQFQSLWSQPSERAVSQKSPLCRRMFELLYVHVAH